MAKSPAYQRYSKDYLSSIRVQMMSLEEEGAYNRLIEYCWLNGWIPSDAQKVVRLVGKGCTLEIAQVCLDMFEPHPTDADKMVHGRLEVEREKQEENSLKRSNAANARWNKESKYADAGAKQTKPKRYANALQVDMQNDAFHVSSTSTTTEEKDISNEISKKKRFAHATGNKTADEIAEALFDNPKPVKPVGSDKFFHECNQGLKDRLKTPARLPDQGKWLQVFQFWLDNEQTSENFLAIFDLKDEIRVRKKEKWTISPSVMEKAFGKLESLKLELEELKNGGNGNGTNQPNYKSALERREESKLIEINAIEQIRTRVAERNRERNVPRTNSLGS